RHLVTQPDIRALFPRTLRQSSDKTRAIPSAAGRDKFARYVPFDRYKRSRDSRSAFGADWPFYELNSVFNQKIVGRDILVGKDADKISVAVPGISGVVTRPIRENTVGRILDPELLLQSVATAEVHSSPAENAA